MKQRAMKFSGIILTTVTSVYIGLTFVLFILGRLENDMVPFGFTEVLTTIIYALPFLTVGLLFLKYGEFTK